MKLRLKVNAEPLTNLLRNAEDAADPTRGGPMMDGVMQAMDIYMDSMRVRFASASAHDGTWAEHAPSTIKRRGEGATILIETGHLEESLSRGGADHYLEITPFGIVEGSSDRTAAFHQNGAPENNLPARPIFVLPDPEILQRMAQPILTGFVAALKLSANS